MKALTDYPRPANDTGIGLHLSANAWDARYYGYALRDVTEWRQMGVCWLKVCTGSDAQLEPVKQFVRAGFEVIVRFYEHQPHPWYVPPVDLMQRFRDVGVHYVEGGNEPELPCEWKDEHIPARAYTPLAEQYIRFADACAHAGVIPITYSIEGDRLHTWFKMLLWEIRRLGRLDAIEGSVVGIHNRPGRMPIDSPPIDETWGGVGFVWRSYEEWVKVITAELGWCPPLLGTEAGREPPETNGDLLQHARDNVDIATRDWLPQLFCQCFWLWPPGGMGNEVAWTDNTKYGRLPVVQWMMDASKRNRSGTSQPEPPVVTDEYVRAIGRAYPSAVSLNPDAALFKAGVAAGLGWPETSEWEQLGHIWQKWQHGVTICKVGEWDKVRVVRW